LGTIGISRKRSGIIDADPDEWMVRTELPVSGVDRIVLELDFDQSGRRKVNMNELVRTSMLGRNRARLIQIPPQATIKADILEDEDVPDIVNIPLKPQAPLTLETLLHVIRFFHSHDGLPTA
jgi:hypothetical protein